MISTRWFQGRKNLDVVLAIRKDVSEEQNEDMLTDIFDEFAFNAVLFDDDTPAGAARLLFKEGKYFIDRLCVKSKFKGLNYEDLLIRMLVRKAVTIGAEKTFTEAQETHAELFENIGFTAVSKESGRVLMVKEGDVGGSCCGKCPEGQFK